MTYAIGNPSPGLGQDKKIGGIKLFNEIIGKISIILLNYSHFFQDSDDEGDPHNDVQKSSFKYERKLGYKKSTPGSKKTLKRTR